MAAVKPLDHFRLAGAERSGSLGAGGGDGGSADWDSITGKPATYPPSAHQHDFTNDITGKPATYPPSTHNHDSQYPVLSGGKIALSTVPDLPASQITSGTLDPARIPVLRADIPIFPVSGNITGLSEAEQNEINTGTQVILNDGRRMVYKGTGSKTVEASYVELADITPEWTSIANKPATFAPSAHNHDDLYYTETEVDTLLTGKANINDSRFTDARALLAGSTIPEHIETEIVRGATTAISQSDQGKNITWNATGTCPCPNAATLGAGFKCEVYNDSGGNVILDGSGSTNVTFAAGEWGTIATKNGKVVTTKGAGTVIS